MTASFAQAVETDSEQQSRVKWEAERIAEARAALDAGFYVDANEIDKWIDSLGSGLELPPPCTRRLRSGG